MPQPVERFDVKVERTQSCWIWHGATNQKGYGRFYYEGRTIPAHHFALWQAGRTVPPSLTVDHLCRNPSCVNPEHMEVVSNRENILRGVGPTATNARKTECVNGHDIANAKAYFKSGRGFTRVCLEYSRLSCAAWRTKRRHERS